MAPTTGSKKSNTAIENRLPSFRNYWRLGSSPGSPPKRPPAYLLKPHLIASSANGSENGSEGRSNPNAKYYKLRHGLGAGQFSPLNDEMLNYHQYRVRLFDPTPFRGVTRFAFWILFLSLLILLTVLITALLRVEDFHEHDHDQHLQHVKEINNANDHNRSFRESLIFKTLVDRRRS